MGKTVRYFNWYSLCLTLLHNHLTSDSDLEKLFIQNFGKSLTREQLQDAFMSGYYFFSKVHNITIKNFDDLERLEINLENF